MTRINPGKVEHLSVPVLQQLLGDNNKLLESFTTVSMDHAGAQGNLSVVNLHYAGETDLPRQLVAKQVIQSGAVKADDEIGNFARREVLIYQQGNDFTGAPGVHCYHASYDPQEHSGFLLLELLEGIENEDCFFMSPERLALRARATADMHGKWWNSEVLDEMPLLFQWGYMDDEGTRLLFDNNDNVARYLGNYRAYLNDFYHEMLGLMVAIRDKRQLIVQSDHTFVHGDLHAFNCPFLPDGTVRFIDWNLSGKGHPGIDLASLTAVSGEDTEYRLWVALDAWRHRMAELTGESFTRERTRLLMCEGMMLWAAREVLFRQTVDPDQFDARLRADAGIGLREALDARAENWKRLGVLDYLRSHVG